MDVGANPIEGDPPYAALLSRGYARVSGFEPQPEALEALNAAKSDAETYYPYALGDGLPANLHLFKHSGFASIFPVHEPSAKLIGFKGATKLQAVLEVETKALDDITDLPPIDFLKIDVQGAEKGIIEAASGKLAGAVAVMPEVRFFKIYEGEPSFGDLDRELTRQGFQFHDFDFLKRVSMRTKRHGTLRPRSFRQVLDGDAIYIRDMRDAGTLTDTQLWKMALIADGVFASFDLAIFALDALAARGVISETDIDAYISALPSDARKRGVS